MHHIPVNVTQEVQGVWRGVLGKGGVLEKDPEEVPGAGKE